MHSASGPPSAPPSADPPHLQLQRCIAPPSFPIPPSPSLLPSPSSSPSSSSSRRRRRRSRDDVPRRKTLRWSRTEVDALLAGVRREGVGRWAAILRGSHVFAGRRTSIDLKDKWRNVRKDVRDEVVSGEWEGRADFVGAWDGGSEVQETREVRQEAPRESAMEVDAAGARAAEDEAHAQLFGSVVEMPRRDDLQPDDFDVGAAVQVPPDCGVGGDVLDLFGQAWDLDGMRGLAKTDNDTLS